ncbi:MAG: DUF4331 domain-containing protein [Verrucomicrobiota bacterium]|nr:DUF4331 domain-containing protein [Verrucomicrobiota bacterium]
MIVITSAPYTRRASFLATVAGVALSLIGIMRLHGSDHIDSPTITQDRGSDIADVYAFLDPNDNSQVILIASTQGFVVSGEHFGMVIFDHNIRYRFEIENTGDAKPDMFLDVNYSPGLGRVTNQTATITLRRRDSFGKNNDDDDDKDDKGRGRRDLLSFKALTTVSDQEPQPEPAPAPVVTVDPRSGAKFFGGAGDDPFFLDDTGANRFVASSINNPGKPDRSLLGFREGRDTYAGFNTMITAVSVPASLLRGNSTVIGVNFVCQRRFAQLNIGGAVVGTGPYVTVDRQGTPLVNNGLIPPPRKNEYNGASTEDDARGRFTGSIVQALRNFATDDAFINAILDVAQRNGDILRLDLQVQNFGPQGGNNPEGGFGNMGGRRLVDDVVDATFTMINNGVPLSDFVDANEVPFRDVFPFVADPTQPFPPGQNPDDGTRQ